MSVLRLTVFHSPTNMSADKELALSIAVLSNLLTEIKVQTRAATNMNTERAIYHLMSLMYPVDELRGDSILEIFQSLREEHTPLVLQMLAKITPRVSSVDGQQFFEVLHCGLLAQDVMALWHSELMVHFKKWLLQSMRFEDEQGDCVFEKMESEDIVEICKSDPEVFAIFEQSASASSEENRKRMQDYRERHGIEQVDLLQLALR